MNNEITDVLHEQLSFHLCCKVDDGVNDGIIDAIEVCGILHDQLVVQVAGHLSRLLLEETQCERIYNI